MGRFSTTVHIKNNVDRMRFVNTFSDVMKKQGFVPCSEDEAAQSYLFAFGEGWVTLTSEEYKDNPQKAYDDSRDMAAALKTSAFSVEVVDSDFALLKLSNSNGVEDEVVIGDGSGYGIKDASKGERGCWEPLLVEDKTWKQLSVAWRNDEVLIEDTLCGVAPLLGIEPKYMAADHVDMSEIADSDKNINVIYFAKTTGGKKSKPISSNKSSSTSFNTAFTLIFGEALQPLGFKKIESQHPYFVRLVSGGEIIHVITYAVSNGLARNQKTYEIYGGAATIYRGKIDFSPEPRNNLIWLVSNTDIYNELYPVNNNFEFVQLNYIIGDVTSMFSKLPMALAYTMQFLLPKLNSIKTLSEYSDFYWTFNSTVLKIYGDEDWGMSVDEGQSDGLMLLKIYNTNVYKTKSKESSEHLTKSSIALFDELLNNPRRNAEALEELERRKAVNSEVLHRIGLNI